MFGAFLRHHLSTSDSKLYLWKDKTAGCLKAEAFIIASARSDAAKPSPTSLNEAEVTHLLCFWQGLPRSSMTWKRPVGVVSQVWVFVGAKRWPPPQERTAHRFTPHFNSQQSLETESPRRAVPIQPGFPPSSLPSLAGRRGTLSFLVRVIALMKALLISMLHVCSSQIVPSSLVATRDL